MGKTVKLYNPDLTDIRRIAYVAAPLFACAGFLLWSPFGDILSRLLGNYVSSYSEFRLFFDTAAITLWVVAALIVKWIVFNFRDKPYLEIDATEIYKPGIMGFTVLWEKVLSFDEEDVVTGHRSSKYVLVFVPEWRDVKYNSILGRVYSHLCMPFRSGDQYIGMVKKFGIKDPDAYELLNTLRKYFAEYNKAMRKSGRREFTLEDHEAVPKEVVIPREYPWVKAILGIILTGILIGVCNYVVDGEYLSLDGIAGVALIGVAMLFLAHYIWFATSKGPQLETSETGVTVYYPNCTTHISWDNLKTVKFREKHFALSKSVTKYDTLCFDVVSYEDIENDFPLGWGSKALGRTLQAEYNEDEVGDVFFRGRRRFPDEIRRKLNHRWLHHYLGQSSPWPKQDQ